MDIRCDLSNVSVTQSESGDLIGAAIGRDGLDGGVGLFWWPNLLLSNSLLPLDDGHVREGGHVLPVFYADAEGGLVVCDWRLALRFCEEAWCCWFGAGGWLTYVARRNTEKLDARRWPETGWPQSSCLGRAINRARSGARFRWRGSWVSGIVRKARESGHNTWRRLRQNGSDPIGTEQNKTKRAICIKARPEARCLVERANDKILLHQAE